MGPVNQQNGIFPFLHFARMEITSYANGKHEKCHVFAPSPVHRAAANFSTRLCQLFALDPFPPQQVVPVGDGRETRKRDIWTGPGTIRYGTGTGTGTRPLRIPLPLLHLSSDSKHSRNSGSAQLFQPLTSSKPTLHRCRGPFQTADLSYDALLVLIGEEVPPRPSADRFPAPLEALVLDRWTDPSVAPSPRP